MIHQNDVKFIMVRSYSTIDVSHYLFRCEALGLQMEQYCCKYPTGNKTKNYFFIDDDDREFHSLESLVDAYNEKSTNLDNEKTNRSQESPHIKVIYINNGKKSSIQ